MSNLIPIFELSDAGTLLLGYIGPGAGFALAGSFLAVFSAILSAISIVLFWPVRKLFRYLFRKKPPGKSRFKRVVVLGLDGLDHGLTQKMLNEGKLPHLDSLKQRGSFSALGSTLPPISPVAWSTFQTGVNPGKHNIFDFLTPDIKTCQPKLSSVEIRTIKKKFGWGPFSYSYSKPDIRMLRKSRPFWSVLSDYGIFNCILRVPITFPPEKLHGVQLSAMCVPDLKGTQGTFTQFTTKDKSEQVKTGGEIHHVKQMGNIISCELTGPQHPEKPEAGPLKLPFELRLINENQATISINGSQYSLLVGQYTEWVTVKFSWGWRKQIQGICKFMLLKTSPHVELYVTPINLDPAQPVMQIGYPPVYSVYLSKQQGPYATLGLAEDTWGLSEEVLDDSQFLKQCMDIDVEREKMFFDGIQKVREGLCVCVFDGTDRMQHMFWRYHDPEHPARPTVVPKDCKNAIEDLYQRMDQLVGRTIKACDREDTLLMVLSDHGFNTFRRGVDLNRWLEEQGYLVVKDEERGNEYLTGIDWTKTRAFTLGLAGIFINLKGKFENGIVEPGEEAEKLKEEIATKLRELKDPKSTIKAIKRVYQANKVYRGPYKDNAPDLLIGYESGFRISWDAAVGKTTREIFHDNHKAWSGDHCVDPSVVPGVLFSNHEIEATAPRLLDLAPTILTQFGCPVPEYMDGQPLTVGRRKSEISPATPQGGVA